MVFDAKGFNHPAYLQQHDFFKVHGVPRRAIQHLAGRHGHQRQQFQLPRHGQNVRPQARLLRRPTKVFLLHRFLLGWGLSSLRFALREHGFPVFLGLLFGVQGRLRQRLGLRLQQRDHALQQRAFQVGVTGVLGLLHHDRGGVEDGVGLLVNGTFQPQFFLHGE